MTYRALQIQSACSANSSGLKKSPRLCVSASNLLVRYIQWLREQLFQPVALRLPPRIHPPLRILRNDLPRAPDPVGLLGEQQRTEEISASLRLCVKSISTIHPMASGTTLSTGSSPSSPADSSAAAHPP